MHPDSYLSTSGEGFHGSGNHLSGLKVNEYAGRARGLAAAEQRLATQRKIGKGGVLGGNSVRGRSMKEVLAEVSRALDVRYGVVVLKLTGGRKEDKG